MISINIHSEPFRRDGNISAEGASKLLGRPSLTPLELLLRETLQNSWDASIGQATQPSYGIKIRSLNENEKNSLRTFFADLPPSGSKEKETLDEELNINKTTFKQNKSIEMRIENDQQAKSFENYSKNFYLNFSIGYSSLKNYDVYNTSTNKLQVYNGSAWQDCN